jgi:hypothetical protein
MEETKEKRQRSIFDDGFTGSVIRKKRRRPVATGPSEPRAKAPPKCKLCSGAHSTRSCRVGR